MMVIVVIMLVCMFMAMMGIVVSVGRHREVFLHQSIRGGKTMAWWDGERERPACNPGVSQYER